ncbi:hypothetical protein Hanom_Chr00s000449g01644111 [Helianthus anomalus]
MVFQSHKICGSYFSAIQFFFSVLCYLKKWTCSPTTKHSYNLYRVFLSTFKIFRFQFFFLLYNHLPIISLSNLLTSHNLSSYLIHLPITSLHNLPTSS